MEVELDGTGYPTRVFVRRCGWCGVRLRGWQVNLCQLCGPAVRSSDFRSSPCVQASRWDEPMDRHSRLSWWLHAVFAALVVVIVVLGLVLR